MKALNNTYNGQPDRHSRIVHTMIRVSNLERSLTFYLDVLGMQEFRREDYPEGNFTLAFVGYGDETLNPAIELTHNWGQETYQHGTGFGHIAIGVFDIFAFCKSLASEGVKIIREPRPMSFTSNSGRKEVIAFIEDPDGYSIELIEKPSEELIH